MPSGSELYGRATQSQTACGGVGKIDLLNYKYAVKQYFLTNWLHSTATLPVEVKESMRMTLHDHATYRTHNGLPNEDVNLSWKAGWSAGAATYYSIFESLIYGNEYDDGVLKPALRSKKNVVQMLESPGISELMAEAEEELQNQYVPQHIDSSDNNAGDNYEVGTTAGGTTKAGAAACDAKPVEHHLLSNRHLAPETLEHLKFADLDTLENVARAASTLMRTHLTFVEDTPNGEEHLLLDALAKTRAGTYMPVAHGVRHEPGSPPNFSHHVGVVYNVGCSGEAITNPKTRTAAYRDGHFKRLIDIALKLRANAMPNTTGINPADYYVLMNAGKEGNEPSMMAAFTGPALLKHKATKMLVFEEDSVTARLDRVRGSIAQTETFTIIAADPIVFPAKKKLHFAGSARGAVIGPVSLPNYQDDAVFKLTLPEKKLLYDTHRVAVGGPTEDGPTVMPSKDVPIPVFYKFHPVNVAEEIGHCLDLVALLDLTPGQGSFALAAIRAKFLWVGVTFNKIHTNFLKEFLLAKVV